jgi:hypothetical protein
MSHTFKLWIARGVLAAAVVCSSLVVAAPASAHHALEALYDTSLEVDGTAILVHVDWINPHAWMRFDIRYPDGRIDKDVMLETLGIVGLRALGVDKAALKLGLEYLITYYPNRDGSPGGFMTKMVLPTGERIASPKYDETQDDGDGL